MKKLLTIFGLLLFGSSFAVAQSSSNASPPDGLNEVSAYSLYYENFKNDNYKDALRYGRWILNGMPKSIEGYPPFSLTTNLDRLITVYTGMADEANDPSVKAAYIDTANSIYSKVFANFSEDEIDYYQWHINRGRFMFDHKDYIDDADAKVTAEYKAAYELKPVEMATLADGYYLRVMLNNMVSAGSETSKQDALALIDEAEENAGDDLNSFFDTIRNKLFDSPEERIGFIEEKLQEEPENQNLLRQLRSLYQSQDNLAKMRSINEKLYEIDPSYQNATALANTAMENAEYAAAIDYLKEAANKTTENEKLKTIYMNLANAYLNQDNLQAARTNARKAINADGSWGQPLIVMADIYARAVSNCTSGREMNRNDRAVYWLVLDYLSRAKRADSSLSTVADNRINSYADVTPSKEDIFFVDSWKKGQSVRIDGSLAACYSWIGESTTVR